MTAIKQLAVVWFWVRMIGFIYAASIRNPADIDDIIDLDHEYLTYSPYHINDDVTDPQYNIRVNKGDNFVPLRRNHHIDLNVPMCYLNRGNVECELGNEQDTHFYHDDARSVAVAISNENGTMKMKGILNTDNHSIDIEPLEATDLPSNRYHVIKKRWTANIIQPSHSRSKRGVKRQRKARKPKKTRIPRKPKRTKKPPKKSKCNTCSSGGVHIQIGIGIGLMKASQIASTTKRKVPSYESPYKSLPPLRQPSSSAYCIDILCVVDYSVYSKYLRIEKTPDAAMKKIRYHYSHVINGVNMRYGSIKMKDLEINVRLAGFFIAKQARDLSFIDSKKIQRDPTYRVDSNYTLTYLDKFLKKLQSKPNSRQQSNVLPDFNHATLFLEYSSANMGGSVLDSSETNLDEPVYADEEQHGGVEDGISGDKGGTSFVGGICSRTKSTSLVVDHGAPSGITTHELGHNLGVFYHDGEGTAKTSKCNGSFNYIMAPASYLIDKTNLKYSFSFSECSLKQIKENLEELVKMNRNCLQCSARERNSVADIQMDREFHMNLETLPGEIDNVHAQCEHLYGKGSFMCPPTSPEEMCYRMYCYDPRRSACAIISEQMAADGTPCGKYKICTMGKCIANTVKGIDTPDDCPYPDFPQSNAHCEDATPYMCKNEKFRQKCCTSCNKKFSKDDMCKDSHVIINGLNCKDLILRYGYAGCTQNPSVANLCCISCKSVLQSGAGSVMIHIGIGSGNAQAVQPKRSRQSSRTKYFPSSKTNPKTIPSRPKSAPPQKPNPPTSGNCVDDPTRRINNLSCSGLIGKDSRYCRDSNVRKFCCKSCQPYK